MGQILFTTFLHLTTHFFVNLPFWCLSRQDRSNFVPIDKIVCSSSGSDCSDDLNLLSLGLSL